MIRILVVEDNAIVRQGLCVLLQAEPDFEVAGEACNGLAAITMLKNNLVPDIILSDLNMPISNGFELTKQVTTFNPAIAVIILTMHERVAYRDKALAAGARGYLLKGDNEQELVNGIRAVYAGNIFVSANLTVMQ